MKELKCKNCGGELTKIGPHEYKCEYCGSKYEEREWYGEIRFVEVMQAKAEKLCATIEVPFEARHYMSSDDIRQFTIRELTHKLAEGLAAYMRVDVNEDPCRMATIVMGTVRVIPPDHRF